MTTRYRIVVSVMAALLPAAAARAQPVQGDVRSVGFEANVSTRQIVREGQWFPILVELAAQTGQPIQCSLVVDRADIDGDRVQYTVPLVALTPGAGLRRVWCYAAVTREDIGRPLTVEVLDEQGAPIVEIPAPPFEPIGHDYLLVLDISATATPIVQDIDARDGSYLSYNWGNRTYVRNACVARLPAANLPDRWIGLEAADVIVWDDPDPHALESWQLQALIDWIRHGGQLILGVGPAWTRLQSSLLAPILPIAGSTPSVQITELPTFTRAYSVDRQARFENPVSVAVGALQPDAVATMLDIAGGRPFPLVSIRPHGSGRVTAVAARIRDLAQLGPRRTFLHELFDLPAMTDDYRRSEAEQQAMLIQLRSLYGFVVEGIEFRAQASLRVLAAFAFVAAYIGLSTFASWYWLQRRRVTHLSWSVFAGFAVAASVLSLGAVGLSRGVADAVHSVSFVDAEAGSGAARGVSYYGYRSPTRQRADLRLAADVKGALRPLSNGPERSIPYATPERYASTPGEGALRGVLMRATLKEFEARWEATLAESIRGRLTTSRATGQLTPESWIQNELDRPIAYGCILYIDPRLDGRGGVPARAAMLARRSDRAEVFGQAETPPAFNVLAVEFRGLPSGGRATNLGESVYTRLEQDHTRWASGPLSAPLQEPDPKIEPWLPTLWSLQNQSWLASTSVLGWQERAPAWAGAMLLASTRNLYLPNPPTNDFRRFGTPISTDGLMDVDVTHWLSRGQAVLLAVVEAPAAVHLSRNGRLLPSSVGRTLYRVRIPIDYVGRPPTGSQP